MTDAERPRIPRHSPELIVHVGDIAVTATYQNARLCMYRQHGQLDHIHFTDKSIGYSGRHFGDRRTQWQLFVLNYPYIVSTYPLTDDVLDAYERYQADKLHGELGPPE